MELLRVLTENRHIMEIVLKTANFDLRLSKYLSLIVRFFHRDRDYIPLSVIAQFHTRKEHLK